jgi:hypothetical protein
LSVQVVALSGETSTGKTRLFGRLDDKADIQNVRVPANICTAPAVSPLQLVLPP